MACKGIKLSAYLKVFLLVNAQKSKLINLSLALFNNPMGWIIIAGPGHIFRSQ